MTTHELGQMLLSLPNTDLVGQVAVELNEKRLAKMKYPYPFMYINGEVELGDTGYSDGVTCLHINIHENDLKELITVNNKKNVIDSPDRGKDDSLPDFSGKVVYLPGDPLDGMLIQETVKNARPNDPNSNFWVVRLKGVRNPVQLYDYEMV